jgi:predicted metal-dependent phosphoesterase TrpH
MTPLKIVHEARRKGLDLIAITDHNSAENVAAVTAAAGGEGPRVIPGIEITTAEEVHILGLFGRVADALAMQSLVYDRLQPGENDEDLFGMQVVSNERDEVEGFNNRLLIGATSLSLDQVVSAIHSLDGLAVAAHVDREAFSLVGQLGFIPEDLPLDAVEISARTPLKQARDGMLGCGDAPLITSSDAHHISDVGTGTTGFLMEDLRMSELKLALKNERGRGIRH